MLNIDKTKFDAVVREAKAKAVSDPACLRAIDRAVQQMDTNPYLHYENGELLCAGVTTDEIYRANGTCQCPAFNLGKLCWHRVLAKLLKRYQESLEAVGVQRQGDRATTEATGGSSREAGARTQRGVVPSSRLQQSIYQDRNGIQIKETRCEGWLV